MLTNETINKLLGITESYQAPQVYFIRNDSADFLGFSEVIRMKHCKELEHELGISFEGGNHAEEKHK